MKIQIFVKFGYYPEESIPYRATLYLQSPTPDDWPKVLLSTTTTVFGTPLRYRSCGDFIGEGDSENLPEGRYLRQNLEERTWEKLELLIEQEIEEAANVLRTVKAANKAALKSQPKDHAIAVKV